MYTYPPYIWAFLAVSLIAALLILKRSGHIVRVFFLNALGGAGALCAVCAVSRFVELSVGLNLFTVLFSCMFSVPGVILLLLLNALVFGR